MQGLGIFFLFEIAMVLATAVKVAKNSYSDEDEESFRNPSKFLVWLLLYKEGEMYIKECYNYTFCIASLKRFAPSLSQCVS